LKPNVIFLTIDSLRGDKCIGKTKSSKTPNLDKLIDEGVYFSQAISSSDQTGSLVIQVIVGALVGTGITIKIYWHKLKEKFTHISKSDD